MPLVRTVRGDIESSQLGVTMMHEHIFALSPEINLNYPETWGDEDSRVTDAVARLEEAKAHGVDTIVDVTPLGLGRFIPRIKRIAEATGINIVVCTGLYTWDVLPMYFRNRGPGTVSGGPEIMTEMFVRDIEEGVADTGVRAGIIKCATHTPGVTPAVDRVLRACAQAHRETGVPITTHTFEPPNGLDQQRIFQSEGVDLSQVVIGHIDRSSRDLDYINAVLDNGSSVGFDQFGNPHNPSSLDDRVSAIAELCRRGYADRIVVSHDFMCYCDMLTEHWDNPDWRYSLIVDDAVPAFRKAGISEEDIQKLLVDNPRRVLEGTTPY